MNFQFYVEKLFGSDEFQSFIKENADAHPVGGFFVIDRENMKNPDNKSHLDYFAPSIKKMFSFQMGDGIKMVPVESFGDKAPEKVGVNYDFDFEEIEDLIRAEMKDQGIDKKLQKILLSLQSLEGKGFLVGTVFTSSMGILKVTVDLEEMKVVDFESKSFFDMIKTVAKGKS